jgi:hypothetical protein
MRLSRLLETKSKKTQLLKGEWAQLLTPAISVTWETKIRIIYEHGQPGQKVTKTSKAISDTSAV